MICNSCAWAKPHDPREYPSPTRCGTRIEARYRGLKFGRSQYFQMLVEWDLRFLPEIHAHKSDGKWHFYPEHGAGAQEGEHLRAAEDAEGRRGRRRRRSRAAGGASPTKIVCRRAHNGRAMGD